MNTPKVETISWKELTGNKYTKGLHPAMVSAIGYIADREIRRIGDVKPTVFKVRYDHQYVMEYIGKTLCKTLSNLGKEKVLELVSNAWDEYYGIEPIDTAVDRRVS